MFDLIKEFFEGANANSSVKSGEEVAAFDALIDNTPEYDLVAKASSQ